MHPQTAVPEDAFLRPLIPEDRDQGDPYVLSLPASAGGAYRYYAYVSGEHSATGRAFPTYGSPDLVHWRPLGGALLADVTKAHWAPCVWYVPSLARPYVMLYSRGRGLGEQAHIGHVIRRADAAAPAGPFVDSGHVLTPDLDFAIDPDVYRSRDGTLRVAFATDFVAEAPLGTGLVDAPVSEDLTSLLGPPAVLARARYPWQVYDPRRKMRWKTIPGVNWDTDTVEWHTLEGPVGGLVSPLGRDVYLYSGGCFWGYYAIGALVRDERGRLEDLSGDESSAVLYPRPERALYGPGHCSWVRAGSGDHLIMFHARFGSPEAPRQMALAPLRWNARGLPYVPLDAGLAARTPET